MSSFATTLGAWFTSKRRRSGLPKQLEPQTAQPAIAPLLSAGSAHIPCDLVPSTHLQNYLANPAPKVAIIGDSTATTAANNLWRNENIWGTLQAKLQRDNATKTHTFSNFALGGANFSNFMQTGTESRLSANWFTAPGRTWSSYVEAFAPDLLFICCGINAAIAPQLQFVRAFLANVATWATVPDIVFLTNKSANPEAITYNPTSLPYYPGQAAMIRTLCRANGAGLGINGLRPLGLIDLGRYQTMASFGYDPASQFLHPVVISPITGITGFPYSCPATSFGDLDLQIAFPRQGATLWSGGATAVVVTLSDFGFGFPCNNISFSHAGGVIVTTYRMDGYSIRGIDTISGTGDIAIRIVARGERVTALVNGTTTFDRSVSRYVKKYNPSIHLLGTPTNPVMTLVAMREGQARRVDPFLSPAQVWGTDYSDGNGINHLSSEGVATIDAVVIDANRFS